ncbi:MAG: chemotaxis protein CheX, partial [Helicobacter sp.]|nr:chemotaxis protein CheX [Helicobacter sp.]
SHDNLMGAMITFDGDISGGLVLIFNKDIVKEAAMMMLGEEVESDGDLVDVVSEFTNIIAGRSKALLSERNISINISLPKPYVNFKELYALIVGKMGVQVDFLLNNKPLYIFLTY